MSQPTEETKHPINTKPLENPDDPTVKRIINIIDRWTPTLQKKIEQDQLVTEALQDVLTVQDRQRNKRVGALFLQGMRMKVRRKLQVPDWKLEAEGVSDKELGFITDAIVQKMKEGGYIDTMTGKWGVFDGIVTTGDKIIRVGSMKNDLNLTEGDKKKVVFFQPTDTDKVFYDAFSGEDRNVGEEWSTKAEVLSYMLDWDTAVDLVPEIAEKATLGALPNADALSKRDNDRIDDHQQSFIDARKIQLGFLYDKTRKIYALVAGRTAAKIFELKDDKYPFVFKMGGEAYKPSVHFQAYQWLTGNYSTGVCGLFYDLAMIWQELDNRGFAYMMENLDPIKIINLPEDQREKFYTQLEMAEETQANGGRGIIVNETDNPNLGKLETMSAPQLSSEFERAIGQIRMNADMLGIKLDELSSAASKPLGTTKLELASQGESIDSLIDVNRQPFEFLVKITLDAIIRDVKDNDEEPVSSDRTLLKRDKEGELERDELGTPITVKPEGENVITMGDVAKRLRELVKEKVVISVKVNVASGAVKNHALELAEIINELNDPNIQGTLHAKNLRKRLATLRGFSVTDDDLSNPQAQLAAQQVKTQPIPVEV